MSTDPRLYRRFLLRAPHEGRASVLAQEFGISPSGVYRLRAKALADQALQVLGECAYTPGPNYAVFVDHIDTAYGGFSDSHQLPERGLRPDNLGIAQGVRLAPGWVNTGSQVTYVILTPIPPALAGVVKHFGRVYRHQEKSEHGTAQFYIGKNGASVVLHLRNRPYPDGMEDQVPRFQKAEAQAWIQEIVNAFPGLRVVNRPIWHPDPKAQESHTPLPSGELVKRIHGVDTVAKERVGPATETNNSPPGPAIETAGIIEAQKIAQAPFLLDEVVNRLAALEIASKEGFEKIATILERLFPKEPQGPAPSSGPAPQGGRENPPGYA